MKLYNIFLFTIALIYLKFINANNISSEIVYDHTSIYVEKWDVNRNDNNLFFDSYTFGIYLNFLNPCARMTNYIFRYHVNKHMNCNGKWCRNGKFIYESVDKSYEVEHIIDKNGPEFSNCSECKNIVANYVFSYGKWNRQLGKFTKNKYDSVVNEKNIVYGSLITNTVRAQIKLCMDSRLNTNLNLNQTYCDSDLSCSCDSDTYSDIDCDCDYTEYDCVDYNLNDKRDLLFIYVISGIAFVCLCLIVALIVALYYRRTHHHHPVRIITADNYNNDDEDDNEIEQI